MSTNFLYFQSIVQYRIPIKDDGTLGIPEITKKFTSPIKGAQGYNKKKAPQQTLTTTKIEETTL